MQTARLIAALLLGLITSLPGVALANKTPEVDKDGLHLQHKTKLRAVYLKPGADFSGYQRVKILEPYVAFRKDWLRDHRQTDPLAVTHKDMEEMKQWLAEEFIKVYTKELAEKGYTVTDETGDDVLLLRPAIANLDVAAPDTMRQAGRTRTFAANAGSMTLYVELYDSATSDLIGRVIDPEVARDYGGFMPITRGTNRMEADRILRKWSDALRDYLDAAHEHATGD